MIAIIKHIMALRMAGIILVVALGSGCATSRGSVSAMSVPIDPTKIATYNEVVVEVIAKEKVPIKPEDRERIKALIIDELKKDTSRFKEINPAQPGFTTLQANVLITRYDEGNVVARLMLAGLGQMHIDSEVSLSDNKSGEQFATYEVTKTFAWGGAYGASTKLKDIEPGFAAAVADSINGKVD